IKIILAYNSDRTPTDKVKPAGFEVFGHLVPWVVQCWSRDAPDGWSPPLRTAQAVALVQPVPVSGPSRRVRLLLRQGTWITNGSVSGTVVSDARANWAHSL